MNKTIEGLNATEQALALKTLQEEDNESKIDDMVELSYVPRQQEYIGR